MGEKDMQLIEQSVKHNVEDIRELKERVSRSESDISDLKANLQVTSQTLTHVMSTLEELKSDFKSVNDKLDKNQIEQLQEYKTGVWKIGATVIAGIVTAFILFYFGL